MRIYAGIGVGIAMIGWFLYRFLIKRDLKNHLNELSTGLFFIGVWFLIYWFLLRS